FARMTRLEISAWGMSAASSAVADRKTACRVVFIDGLGPIVSLRRRVCEPAARPGSGRGSTHGSIQLSGGIVFQAGWHSGLCPVRLLLLPDGVFFGPKLFPPCLWGQRRGLCTKRPMFRGARPRTQSGRL